MSVLIVSIPIAIAEELNLVYDGVGNLKSGDGLVRTYDGFNHLVRIQNDSGNILQDFIWHPQEDRIFIKKIYNSSGDVTQRIVYVNGNTVKIKNSSGTFYEHYILQDGVVVSQIDTNGNKQAIHPDILGSASVVTSANGNTLETNFVSPFGEPIQGGETTRFDYTGKEYDATTKLHDFKARQYKSEWGRMLQVDPIFFDVTKKFARERQIATYDPQLLNPYAYTRNNPYKFVDKDGNTPVLVLFAVVAVLAISYFISGAADAAYEDYQRDVPEFERNEIFDKWKYINELGGAYDDSKGLIDSFGKKTLKPLASANVFIDASKFIFTITISISRNNYIKNTNNNMRNILLIQQEYIRYKAYFNEKSDESSGKSSTRGGGGGSCRCGVYGNLREEAQNAKPGETAGDIIKRWRKKRG